MSTTTTPTQPITGDRLRFGYHRQVWWSWLIGTAFFFGEVGAGLFVVSLFTEFTPGILIGYVIVMLGKNGAHLLYLGRPGRFWRAALRPDRSWIARGIWATGLYGIGGAAWLAFDWGFLPGLAPVLGPVAFWGAVLAALFIMFYDGLVMATPGSVPFWGTAFLPVLCFTYAWLGGVTLWLLLQELLAPVRSEFFGALLLAENGLILLNLLLIGAYVFVMSRRPDTSRINALSWLKGTYAPVFWGLVLFVGLLVAFGLSVSHYWVHGVWVSIAVATAELSGDYALLIVLLKSGLYRPQRKPDEAPRGPVG